MNKGIFALLATACLATMALAAPPTVKYDRFTQTTTVQANAPHRMGGEHQHMDVVSAQATIKEGKVVTLELDVATLSDRWFYLNCHEVHFLVNDKPYTALGTGRYLNAMDGHVTEEQVSFPITREQLAFLVAAERIEY